MLPPFNPATLPPTTLWSSAAVSSPQALLACARAADEAISRAANAIVNLQPFMTYPPARSIPTTILGISIADYPDFGNCQSLFCVSVRGEYPASVFISLSWARTAATPEFPPGHAGGQMNTSLSLGLTRKLLLPRGLQVGVNRPFR